MVFDLSLSQLQPLRQHLIQRLPLQSAATARGQVRARDERQSQQPRNPYVLHPRHPGQYHGRLQRLGAQQQWRDYLGFATVGRTTRIRRRAAGTCAGGPKLYPVYLKIRTCPIPAIMQSPRAGNVTSSPITSAMCLPWPATEN